MQFGNSQTRDVRISTFSPHPCRNVRIQRRHQRKSRLALVSRETTRGNNFNGGGLYPFTASLMFLGGRHQKLNKWEYQNVLFFSPVSTPIGAYRGPRPALVGRQPPPSFKLPRLAIPRSKKSGSEPSRRRCRHVRWWCSLDHCDGCRHILWNGYLILVDSPGMCRSALWPRCPRKHPRRHRLYHRNTVYIRCNCQMSMAVARSSQPWKLSDRTRSTGLRPEAGPEAAEALLHVV